MSKWARWCRRLTRANCSPTWALTWSKSKLPELATGRAGAARFPKIKPNPEKSGLFLYLNTNKLGVTLDLFQPQGMELLERLVADADVLVHNVAPADMDRAGLSFERFRQRNPRLVMTSITPYGLTGPYRDRPAEDLTVWSEGGLTYLNGAGPDTREVPPLKAYGQQAGYQGGIHGAVATTGALMAQLRDNEGQHIDISVHEVCASMLELTYVYWPYGGTDRVAPGVQAGPAAGSLGMQGRPDFSVLRRRPSMGGLRGADGPSGMDRRAAVQGPRQAHRQLGRGAAVRPGMAAGSDRGGSLP